MTANEQILLIKTIDIFTRAWKRYNYNILNIIWQKMI